MTMYEREELVHEVAGGDRSKRCHELISPILQGEGGSKKRILDIGCGDGAFISRYKNACEIHGVDISQKAVDMAARSGLSCQKVDVSSVNLPFESGTFDIVYMGEVIEHLVDPDFAIKDVRRVLKPRGSLILSTPNLACWYNRLLLLLGIQPIFSEVSTTKIFGRPGTIPVGHLRLFTLNALKQFLNYHNFESIKVIGAKFDMLPKSLKPIDTIFAKVPSFASILVIIARRR